MSDGSLHEHKLFISDPGQEPMRIDKFLLDRMFKTSRNRIQNAIKAGSVTVNGKNIKPNYKIRPNDKVEVVIPRPFDQACHIVPDEIPLDIRYEDEDVIVLFKQPGLVVHPGIGNYRKTLVNGLAHYFGHGELPVMDGNPKNRPGLVHRIDKNTSGLMVVAKTEYAMAHLAKQFFNHTIHRRYQAIVWGQPDESEGYIKVNIGRHPRYRAKQAVFPEGEAGKWAGTHWKLVEGLYYVSLIECRLETGRTHQIRVHMAHLGHPLFNDDRYGGNKIIKGTVHSKYKHFVFNCFGKLPRHALHAKEIGFIHPRTEKEVFFDSQLPKDMYTTLQRWRNYVTALKTNKSIQL